MIRRFCGPDGKLVGLHKESLRIGNRRRSPRGILYMDEYYRDSCSDFDDELLKKVEQGFARYYPRIADVEKAEELDGDGGAALIDWIASMLCRTEALTVLSRVIVEKERSPLLSIPESGWKLIYNMVRSRRYEECQDLLSRPRFKWGMKLFPEGLNLVITDNPVCQTNGLQKGGQVTLVPLSKRRILIGGLEEGVERFRHYTIDELNVSLFAWANRSIYAAERATLESIKTMLDEIEDKEWYEAARKPLFGLPERIMDKVIPKGVNISEWYATMKDTFGK